VKNWKIKQKELGKINPRGTKISSPRNTHHFYDPKYILSLKVKALESA